MKLKPRKDIRAVRASGSPVISRSECWAGLRLVAHTLDGIVEQGDVPEAVVARAHEFSRYLETLFWRHHAYPNAADAAALRSAIEAGTLPTFHLPPHV